MSAGHGHPRPNLRHAKEFDELMSAPDIAALMQRWQRVDTDHDIPDLAGYNVPGTVRFVDRDAYHAIMDPGYAEHIGVEPIDTGLSPQDTIACILEHEADEKVLLDADNDIDTYLAAHEYATVGENRKVIARGSTPLRYNRGLAKLIKFCATKPLSKVPRDLACAPMLDDPDKNDLRVIKSLQRLGAIDAFKKSKGSLDYSRSTGLDRCGGCSNWMGHPVLELAPCKIVDGLARVDRWCRAYAARKEGT